MAKCFCCNNDIKDGYSWCDLDDEVKESKGHNAFRLEFRFYKDGKAEALAVFCPRCFRANIGKIIIGKLDGYKAWFPEFISEIRNDTGKMRAD